MSRVGKAPIKVPDGLKVSIDSGKHVISVSGQKGSLSYNLPEKVLIDLQDDVISLKIADKHCKKSREMWGLARSLINNMVRGASTGFNVDLEIYGVGYRAKKNGNDIWFDLGFSHSIIYPVPADINVEIPAPTKISISGADKQKIGQFAANIRALRKPEPYKGKGIRYANEQILRKERKKSK